MPWTRQVLSKSVGQKANLDKSEYPIFLDFTIDDKTIWGYKDANLGGQSLFLL